MLTYHGCIKASLHVNRFSGSGSIRWPTKSFAAKKNSWGRNFNLLYGRQFHNCQITHLQKIKFMAIDYDQPHNYLMLRYHP